MLLPYDPKAIVRLREAKEWSQAELARQSGLSQPSVHDLEKGNTTMPKYTTLKAVADALGVPVSEILAKRPKGESAQTRERALNEAYEALSEANKANLYAIALSLLEQQRGRR
jgi:transcriptional regulator with XRE-family HTH domain